jgi:hypothetical protein
VSVEEGTEVLSGYDTADRFYATRYRQGGRRAYSVDLSLAQIGAYLPIPDPNRPTPGNRRVKESHAVEFGKYVREHENWVAPPLLMRSADIFGFDPRENIGGTQFGIMSIPRLARTDIRILDGQHRILGISRAIDAIAADLEDQRAQLARAKRQGDTPELARQFELKIERLERERARFAEERMSVQFLIEDDLEEYEQMFVDIADNALGITSAVRTRFDNRRVVNRALDGVMKNALLAGRVDMDQDRIHIASPNLMGAKHVADIIRTVAVGIAGRVGKRVEDELREDNLVQRTNDFLDALMSGFPDLAAVADGELSPEGLRRRSLLGSTVMLRVLAGAFHELTKNLDDDEVTDYFRALAPHMGAPIETGSHWLETGVFQVGASAPTARYQDLKELTDALVKWAAYPPSWIRFEGRVPEPDFAL